MFEKIMERLEAELKGTNRCFGMNCEECYKKFGMGVDCDEARQNLMIDKCKEIVQEVAKEQARSWERQ